MLMIRPINKAAFGMHLLVLVELAVPYGDGDADRQRCNSGHGERLQGVRAGAISGECTV